MTGGRPCVVGYWGQKRMLFYDVDAVGLVCVMILNWY